MPARGTSVAGSATTRSASARPGRRVGRPGETERRDPRPRLGRRRRLDLRRGQQVGERVEVVADADPALGRRLERRRAAARERVEDDVAAPRVAGDERVGEGGREAREVRAHRVERVAPEALLVLPLGRDPDRRQLGGQLPAQGRGQAGTRAVRSSSSTPRSEGRGAYHAVNSAQSSAHGPSVGRRSRLGPEPEAVCGTARRASGVTEVSISGPSRPPSRREGPSPPSGPVPAKRPPGLMLRPPHRLCGPAAGSTSRPPFGGRPRWHNPPRWTPASPSPSTS